MIGRADSFFIASVYSEDTNDFVQGVDVSHRGGNPGFVLVEDATRLIFPDFAGNKHFNTLGNIVLNPRVGLLFPDFYSGDLLYLTGRAEIIWDGPDVDAFDGAERLVRCEVESVIRVNGSLPFRGGFEAFSPVLRRTGNWQEVIAARRSLNSAL
jgi:predicted pyridoxine 5'-phosphate oxidase superfamily flavin-nucleotide-binding protein